MEHSGVAGGVQAMQANTTELRTRAFNLIKEKSFFRRRVVLASGKESDYYLDLKPSMLDPEGAYLLAKLALARLEEVEVERVGGMAMGAVPLISTIALLSFLEKRPLPAFFVRQAVKDHGTKRKIEGTGDIAGKRVAILEDVTTTGESALVAVRTAQEAGAKVVLVLSLVDRLEGAADAFKRAGIPFGQLFTADEFLRA